MESQLTQQAQINFQPSLPNATAVLVLGILSIVGCACYGIVGLICGIIAIVLANKDIKLYNNNPCKYTENSFNNLKAGQVCAIVGTILASIALILTIAYFAFIGTVFLKIFQEASHHR